MPFYLQLKLEADVITPFEAFTGTKPNVKDMNIFGSTCYPYVLDKKLDSRARKGTFMGYDKYSPAYFIYFKESRDIKRVRCVKFASRFNNEEDDDYDDEMCCNRRKQAAPIDAIVEEHRIEEGESNAADTNETVDIL